MSNYKYYSYFFQPCHEVTEIYPNLFISSERQIVKAIKEGQKFDVLVPLDSLDAGIWDYITPEKTQIFYFPCPDYGILSNKNLDYLVTHIIRFLKKKKRVALFCLGGHGRTGYITACIIGKLGVQNPVQELKTKYCKKIIETSQQMIEVADYLGIDLSREIEELNTKYACDWMRQQISSLLYGQLPSNSTKDAYLYNMRYEELYKMCLSLGILEEDEEVNGGKTFYLGTGKTTTYPFLDEEDYTISDK